jgi:hypothetical protein
MLTELTLWKEKLYMQNIGKENCRRSGNSLTFPENNGQETKHNQAK